jgi:hypothetical protein
MSDDLTPITCHECGICFGLPLQVGKIWKFNRHSFYCPNGHSLVYKQEATEQDKKLEALTAKVAELEKRLANAVEDERKATARAADLLLELEIYKPVSIDKAS